MCVVFVTQVSSGHASAPDWDTDPWHRSQSDHLQRFGTAHQAADPAAQHHAGFSQVGSGVTWPLACKVFNGKMYSLFVSFV